MLPWPQSSQCGGCRHDRAALLAGPEFFRVVEIAVGLGHGIGAIVVDDVGLLVQKVIAARAEPKKSVDVARDSCALDHQLKGIRCKPRRMRNQRWLEQARSLGNESDLLDP